VGRGACEVLCEGDGRVVETLVEFRLVKTRPRLSIFRPSRKIWPSRTSLEGVRASLEGVRASLKGVRASLPFRGDIGVIHRVIGVRNVWFRFVESQFGIF
jgi:hypothetical protein